MASMPEPEDSLERLERLRKEADGLYNDALTALDGALPERLALPHPPAGFDDQQIHPLNKSWRIASEADIDLGSGWRRRLRKLVWDLIRTSLERVRRLMREHDLQAPHRVGHAHGPKAHDGTITTAAPDVMWGTDMTATVTVGEGAAFVFVAVDHCTTECIGLHAAKRGTRFEALEPIRQGVRARFGTIGEGVAAGCVFGTTTGRTIWLTTFNRRWRSSASRAREFRAGARRQRRRGTLHPHAEGELLWVRVSTPSRSSAWPYSSLSGRTTSSGC